MKFQYIFLYLILFVSTITAQITVSVNPVTVSINPSLLGLNGRSTEGPSWTDNNFLTLIDEMNPAYVRYPAGTQGNQWNWKTGTFISSLGQSAKEIFTVPMFINGLPDNTKIIYMVNMVLPTEQTGITFSTTTDSHLATDATLTAKLTDILNALAEFEKYGRIPEVCELGNELYFTNVHAGVYAANPAFYLQHAKIIALAIKNKYPAMKIILCTTKGGTSGRENWNTAIFNALNTDTQLRSAIHGIVQHHYINENYGDLSAVTNSAVAKTIIDEGIGYVKSIPDDYNIVPSNMKLWITEYGATKASADGMWAAGMRVASMTLSFMKWGLKVDNLMWHHITDYPNILNSTKTKLGPAGIAFMQLSKTINGSNSYNKLIFSNMPAGNDYAELTGYLFSAEGMENLLIINNGSTTYSNVNLNSVSGSGTIQYAKQYWSAAPYLTSVSTINNIDIYTDNNLNSYLINPFSITAITKKLSTSIVDQKNDTTIKINTTSDGNVLQVFSSMNENYAIFGSDGRHLQSGLLTEGKNEIRIYQLQQGIYFFKTKNYFSKIIKQ